MASNPSEYSSRHLSVKKKGIPDALQAIANISGMYRFEVTVIGDPGKTKPHGWRKNRGFLEVISRNNMTDYVRLMGLHPIRC